MCFRSIFLVNKSGKNTEKKEKKYPVNLGMQQSLNPPPCLGGRNQRRRHCDYLDLGLRGLLDADDVRRRLDQGHSPPSLMLVEMSANWKE